MDATSASAPAAFLDLAAGSALRFLDGEASAAAPRASERALGRATRSRSRAACSRGAASNGASASSHDRALLSSDGEADRGARPRSRRLNVSDFARATASLFRTSGSAREI